MDWWNGWEDKKTKGTASVSASRLFADAYCCKRLFSSDRSLIRNQESEWLKVSGIREGRKEEEDCITKGKMKAQIKSINCCKRERMACWLPLSNQNHHYLHPQSFNSSSISLLFRSSRSYPLFWLRYQGLPLLCHHHVADRANFSLK